MILGLNTDIRHKGKTFHIQTEDSGKQNPVLITHVFIGGTIIHTIKSDYAEDLEREDLEKHVRGLMRKQHRAAHQALLAGEFDEEASRRKVDKSSIPLAKKRGPVGLMSKPPDAPTTSSPPEPPTEELDADDPLAPSELDEEDVEELGSVDMMPIHLPPPPPPGATDVASVAAVDSVGPAERVTPLLSRAPLDPVEVAWLLEGEQPR